MLSQSPSLAISRYFLLKRIEVGLERFYREFYYLSGILLFIGNFIILIILLISLDILQKIW